MPALVTDGWPMNELIEDGCVCVCSTVDSSSTREYYLILLYVSSYYKY